MATRAASAVRERDGPGALFAFAVLRRMISLRAMSDSYNKTGRCQCTGSGQRCGSCGESREVRAKPPHPSRVLSSSPGGLLPRGAHQNRTRRFPPSGSSADVAHGDAPQSRTRIRGTGRGYRANNATNLGQGSTTFRISGDMSPDVNAPVMGPFESSHQHGPPLLGRVRGPTRSPTGIVRLIRLDPKNLQSRTIRLQVDATRPGRRLGLV